MADGKLDTLAGQVLGAIFDRRHGAQSQLARSTGISQPHLSKIAARVRVANRHKDVVALHRDAGIEPAWWEMPPVSHRKLEEILETNPLLVDAKTGDAA